jgi:hypothetical protein
VAIPFPSRTVYVHGEESALSASTPGKQGA